MNIPWITIGVAASALATGIAGGYLVREEIGDRRIERCATSIGKIREGDESLKGCAVPIQNAFAAVKSALQTTEIEYRDKTNTIVVHDQTEDRQRYAQELLDVQALQQVTKTDACAASPAMRLRREQLLRDEGPAEVPAERPAYQAPR
ncbi:i-spanin [Caulobacter phage Seuss]|uniref:I-spanin n=1 Tax=Caulobacter phage Seuss TaxID=1675601 RepID=A0A0K1LM40_9CAUD|nr:i-spanin [Caulobacter phage Seuss]AKU43571.1 i-spanin [Caulobacter phage Seuss]